MLEVRITKLSVAYRIEGKRVQALRDVNLTFQPGRLHLICGQSGSGKTGLLNALGGLIPGVIRGELQGEVSLAGASVASLSRRQLAQMVGYVFQDPDSYFAASSVEAEVAFGLENLAVPRPEMKRRVEEALAVMGLSHLAKAALIELSGGQKQRVAIACSLALDAQVLLLDEPFTNLDPQGSLDVIACLTELKRRGMNVIIVSHRLFPELMDEVDTVTVIAAGVVRYHGPRENLLTSLQATDLPVSLAFFSPIHGVSEQPASYPGNNNGRVGTELIHADQLSFAYPDTKRSAVQGISLKLKSGELVALVGGNGAGKSTLMRLFNGLLKPTGGALTVCGMDARRTQTSHLARHVGLMFQNPLHTLFCDTVEAELSYSARIQGINSKVVSERLTAVSRQLGIEGLLATSPFSLSAGEQQRVAIGSILVGNPEVVILDEPTHGIDEPRLIDLGRILQKLCADNHLVMVVTHDVDFAYRFAARSVVMVDGRIIADGDTAKVLADQKTMNLARLTLPTVLRLARPPLSDGTPRAEVLQAPEVER